jgi:ATP-dependent Zn protease
MPPGAGHGSNRRHLDRQAANIAQMEIPYPDDLTDAAAYLRGMAFHEAGHAVVAWSLKLPVGDIHIRGIGAGNGSAQVGSTDHLPLIDRIAVCFAGIEAGEVFHSPQPSWAGNEDKRVAFEILYDEPEDQAQQVWHRGGARARELLVEHSDRVTRLATRLIKVQQVDAAEFLRLMAA